MEEDTDVRDSIEVNASRRMPCICERQFDDDARHEVAVVDISYARGIPVHRVECQTCYREWRRVIPQ